MHAKYEAIVMGHNTQDKEESTLQQNNVIDYQTVIYNTKWNKHHLVLYYRTMEKVEQNKNQHKTTKVNEKPPASTLSMCSLPI